ncbi:hypothetical protein STRTUCAR8_09323, partial [Streptomyces turgidiscabies Car8]
MASKIRKGGRWRVLRMVIPSLAV